MDEDNNRIIEEDERQALAGLSLTAPPPRKNQSYSQQLRATSSHKRHSHVRKHSLDEVQVPKNIDPHHHNPCYDSSEEEFFPYSSSTTTSTSPTGERMDQSLCLEVGLDHDSRQCQPLPEFIGSGGTSGIFKVPTRAPVHPGRPPCLELRPHPLRETQVGKFLRNIACTETQLWAGQESGVRVWDFNNVYDPGCGLGGFGGRVKRGDEDAAPFHESVNTSPTLCLMVDGGNRLVWSGHKDGKIRSWKMDQPLEDTPFKEGLSWQAHRGPVLSMVLTSHGEPIRYV